MTENYIYLPEIIIDSHCHARDFRQSYKTTVMQTLKEAKKGLITISALMPNTDPPIISLEVLSDYSKLIVAAENELDLPRQYVWFGVVDGNLKECEEALRLPFVVGLKIYPKKKNGQSVTTGIIGVTEEETIPEAMRLVKKYGKALAIHCDDPDIILKKGYVIEAEVEYVRKIIRYAQIVPGVKIIICHVSCVESASLILWAQREHHMKIAIELCPHYLWFDSEKTNWNPNFDPVYYKCFNNLRPARHRKYLISLLKLNNRLIIIGSDNAPHTREEKMEKGLGGLPTNHEMVAVICALAKQNKIPDGRVAQLLSYNLSDILEIPVSRKTKKYRLEKMTDDIQYNNGKVLNPWNGSELLFPVKIEG